MIEYVLEPGAGVGPVLLGMHRSEVRQLMLQLVEPFRRSAGSDFEVDGFHHAAFQVHYRGSVPMVEFIELMKGPELQVRCLGVEVFSTPVEDLIAHLGRFAAYDRNHAELPYTYIFPDLQLSLWRSTIPEAEDDKEGRCFDTIAVWRKGYYDET